MKKIILYMVNDSKFNRIKEVFKGDDFSVKTIDKRHLESKVGDIFNGNFKENPDAVYEDPLFENEFMLIDGFDTDEDIRDMLLMFKGNLIPRPITSARTKNNENWILKDLLKEIFTENEYMKNMNKGK